MELRTLRYFLAIASERNITKAADILHVTQPTLSRQLSALEKELGTTLFVRSKHALTLTDDGILFRQRAEDIVDMVDRTENEFTGRTSMVGGTIALGVAESMGGRTFAKLIKMFSDTYPDVRFDLFNGMTDTIQDCIDSGTIDLGLLLEPIDTTRYEFMRLPQKELWGILVHRDHPLATQSSVSPQDVIGQSLMLPDRASSRREILNWIGCAEHRLKIILNYNILSNVALLVEEKLGIAFCLNGALAVQFSPNLRFVPMLPERAIRSVLVWKRNYVFNPATSLFIQMLYRFQESI